MDFYFSLKSYFQFMPILGIRLNLFPKIDNSHLSGGGGKFEQLCQKGPIVSQKLPVYRGVLLYLGQ